MSIYIDQKMKEVLARLAVLEKQVELLQTALRQAIDNVLLTSNPPQKPFEPVGPVDKRSREYRESVGRS